MFPRSNQLPLLKAYVYVTVVVSPDDAGELAAAIRAFQHHKVNHSDLIDLSLFTQKNANDYIESLEGLCQTE